jgi:hypothetical protein
METYKNNHRSDNFITIYYMYRSFGQDNPASPKLLVILKNQMMHELSFSAHLIKCDFGNTCYWKFKITLSFILGII